jgi:hypothetical protein
MDTIFSFQDEYYDRPVQVLHENILMNQEKERREGGSERLIN